LRRGPDDSAVSLTTGDDAHVAQPSSLRRAASCRTLGHVGARARRHSRADRPPCRRRARRDWRRDRYATPCVGGTRPTPAKGRSRRTELSAVRYTLVSSTFLSPTGPSPSHSWTLIHAAATRNTPTGWQDEQDQPRACSATFEVGLQRNSVVGDARHPVHPVILSHVVDVNRHGAASTKIPSRSNLIPHPTGLESTW